MNRKNQTGVGMFEVLVALFVLAIGVLGFSALQLRAVDATIEANDKTLAMNVARDLAERIRINRLSLGNYTNAINTQTFNTTCLIATAPNSRPTCNGATLAQYDAREIVQIAQNQGQQIAMADCQGSTRTCIYVAWGHTNIVISNNNVVSVDVTSCMNNGSYVANAKCVVLEAF